MAKFYSLKYHFLLGNQRFLEKKDEIDKMNLEYLDSKKATRLLGNMKRIYVRTLADQRWDNLNFNGRVFA